MNVAALETEKIRTAWNKQARIYDPWMGFWDRVLFGKARVWACSRATGKVLEIGIGTGRNLAHYPKDVRVTGIDISEAMLERARVRAKTLGSSAELRAGDAQTLEFPDESFDTVVSTFSLCSIPDDRRAIAEAARVLRRGGKFVLAEHVRSPNVVVRALEHALELVSPIDHYLRDPLAGLRAEALVIDVLERRAIGFLQLVSCHKP